MSEYIAKVVSKTTVRRRFARVMIDAGTAFGVFALAVMMIDCKPGVASPHVFKMHPVVTAAEVAHTVVRPDDKAPKITVAAVRIAEQNSGYAYSQPNAAIWLLGLSLSLFAALNLAFLRHLRRAYASPRRSGWRRSGSGELP